VVYFASIFALLFDHGSNVSSMYPSASPNFLVADGTD